MSPLNFQLRYAMCSGTWLFRRRTLWGLHSSQTTASYDGNVMTNCFFKHFLQGAGGGGCMKLDKEFSVSNKLTSASIYEKYAMSIMRATSRSVECLKFRKMENKLWVCFPSRKWWWNEDFIANMVKCRCRSIYGLTNIQNHFEEKLSWVSTNLQTYKYTNLPKYSFLIMYALSSPVYRKQKELSKCIYKQECAPWDMFY